MSMTSFVGSTKFIEVGYTRGDKQSESETMKTNPMRLVVLIILTVPTCLFAQTETPTPAQRSEKKQSSDIPSLIEPAKLGTTNNVTKRGNFYFGGQFGKEDIATLQEKKVTRVVTFRMDKEIDWDEEAVLKDAEIECVKLSFGSIEALTDDVFEKSRELFKDNSKTTLFHCGVANRVGGVWLPYRVLDDGLSVDEALAEAKQIGLKSPKIEAKALDYIKRMQSPSMNGEASVKPGVNKNFVDPNMDVDSYIKKFEIESREVFITRERILAACEIEKGDAVADVGAGTGLFSRMFSTVVGDQGWVYAIDISPRFLEHINKESAKNQIENITGVLCAENSVSLPPNSVDFVFICDVYHHFEYPKSTLASIKRALKPGGHMVVIDFERIEGVSRKWTMGHVRAGKEVFQAEILEAGFKLAEEKKIDGFEENYFLKFTKE